MAKDTYKYNGKEYERIPSECKCLKCDFLDEETCDCLAPMPIDLGASCMELGRFGYTSHFQFKEIKL